MENSLTFVTTSDGSKTIFNSQIGEHYHSRHGALQESNHVFLGAGLKYFTGNSLKEVNILEVGFGTGLNFLLSAAYCTSEQIKLNYTGIEAYPLSIDIVSQTGYREYVSTEIWEAFLSNYEIALDAKSAIGPYCTINIKHTLLSRFDSKRLYDLVYFDAFAAIHQPEMWTVEALSHICKFLRPGGVFVTYAITGNLKRAMKSLGFSIEKIPGAPGKREMLRATKL